MVSFRWYEILTYLKKHIFRKVPLSEIIGTAIGCFFGLGLVSYITMQQHLPLLIASFGATSLLIFSAPSAPMAQPRNDRRHLL